MKTFDFKGLKCPIPVLKAYKIIKHEKKQNNFIFLTDDESAPKDFKEFCLNTGYQLEDIVKKKDHHQIIIKKTNSEK